MLGHGPVPGPPAYGHPAIPDWLDEAAATLCEPPQMYGRRLDQMRARLDQRIPLDTLLTMVHPSFARTDSSSASPPPGGASTGLTVRVSAAGESERTTMFYAEAATLARFLWSRGGAELLDRITDTLAHGGRIESALAADARAPSSVSELEMEWLQWVRSQL
jgi:hypothetical protein